VIARSRCIAAQTKLVSDATLALGAESLQGDRGQEVNSPAEHAIDCRRASAWRPSVRSSDDAPLPRPRIRDLPLLPCCLSQQALIGPFDIGLPQGLANCIRRRAGKVVALRWRASARHDVVAAQTNHMIADSDALERASPPGLPLGLTAMRVQW